VLYVRVRATPTKLPLHPWVYPKPSFQRVHIYFCEYKKHFLILVDSNSKRVEVKPTQKTTVDKTLDELRLILQKVQFDRTKKGERMFDVGDVVKMKNIRA